MASLTEQKRPSLQKQSHCSEAGSFVAGNPCVKTQVSGSLSNQLPSPKKRRHTLSPGGQLFLCVLGSVLSFAICIWLSVFSTDVTWRRLVFACGAAACALMFALLAITSMRRVVNPECDAVPPMLRRSTIQKSQKKSMSSAPILRSMDSNETGILPMMDEQRKPSMVLAAVSSSSDDNNVVFPTTVVVVDTVSEA